MLSRISTFANSMSLGLKWKLSQDEFNTIAECTIGDMKAKAGHKNKKTAKLLAAKNILKIIENDSNLKQKMMEHIFGEDIVKPIDDKSTNLSYVKDLSGKLSQMVDSLDAQKSIASSKRFEEPEEIMNYFCNLDDNISASTEEVTELKSTFEQVAEL